MTNAVSTNTQVTNPSSSQRLIPLLPRPLENIILYLAYSTFENVNDVPHTYDSAEKSAGKYCHPAEISEMQKCIDSIEMIVKVTGNFHLWLNKKALEKCMDDTSNNQPKMLPWCPRRIENIIARLASSTFVNVNEPPQDSDFSMVRPTKYDHPKDAWEMQEQITAMTMILPGISDFDLKLNKEHLQLELGRKVDAVVKKAGAQFHYGDLQQKEVNDPRIEICEQNQTIQRKVTNLADYLPEKPFTSTWKAFDEKAAMDSGVAAVLIDNTRLQWIKDMALWYWSQSEKATSAFFVCLAPGALKKAADPNFERGESTALHHCKNEEILKALIAAKADVNRPSSKGITPLQSALKNNRSTIATLLLAAGVKK